MVNLECNVDSCIYNQRERCAKGAISVQGREAMTMCDTCCGSYEKKTGDAATDSYLSGCGCTEPKSNIQVGCEAAHCMYNDNMKCGAEKIGISGYGACDCEETECSTFRTR